MLVEGDVVHLEQHGLKELFYVVAARPLHGGDELRLAEQLVLTVAVDLYRQVATLVVLLLLELCEPG